MNRVGIALVLALPGALSCARASDPSQIVAAGHVEATEVRISTKVAGTLLRLNVDEGAAVAAGQELARDRHYRHRARAADGPRGSRPGRGRAAAAARRLARGGRARGRGAGRPAPRPTSRARPGDLERMEGLLRRGSGTTQARDDARTRNDVARASLDAARERLKRLKAG